LAGDSGSTAFCVAHDAKAKAKPTTIADADCLDVEIFIRWAFLCHDGGFYQVGKTLLPIHHTRCDPLRTSARKPGWQRLRFPDNISIMKGTFSLILETSTPHASLCTITACGKLEEREFTSDRSHNAVLFSPLNDLLNARALESIDLVLVGSGPGSYSGTRVGIAAAQGVAIALGCPVVTIPSILGVQSTQNGSRCLAIGDARRGSYWTAEIEQYATLGDPRLTDIEGLLESVTQALDAGIPVFTFEQPSRFPLPAEVTSRIRLEFPSAGRLWHAWSETSPSMREQCRQQIPQPIYLKPPHITPAKRSTSFQAQV
jgi:tRNA threonylcarbamoyl adenosine modification protein YeaZ